MNDLKLNKKIVKETDIYFTYKISQTIGNNHLRFNYRYIISRNYYETDEKFKNGINDLMNLCGLSLSYSHMSFSEMAKYTIYYSKHPIHSPFDDEHIIDVI